MLIRNTILRLVNELKSEGSVMYSLGHSLHTVREAIHAVLAVFAGGTLWNLVSEYKHSKANFTQGFKVSPISNYNCTQVKCCGYQQKPHDR